MTTRERTKQALKETREVIATIESREAESGEPMDPGIEIGVRSLRKMEAQLVDELAELDRVAARRKPRSVVPVG